MRDKQLIASDKVFWEAHGAVEAGESIFYRGKEYRMVKVLKFKPARESNKKTRKKVNK
mgnify:CR=1 FL=1